MNLYMKIEGGQIVGYPILEDNLQQVLGELELTDQILNSHGYTRIVTQTRSAGLVQIGQPSYEMREDGKVYETMPTRELSQEEKVNFWVRKPRNYDLAMSDWTQMPDVPLSAEKKAEWAVYRQKLRDMTTTYANIQDPSEIVVPVKPT
jgi:hypothetical protein